MLTELGRVLRIFRINRNELLRDMAVKLDLSPAYLSSIENGKRPPTDDFIERIFTNYDLSSQEREDILNAKDKTLSNITIKLNGPGKKEEIGLMFARKFDGLSDRQMEELKKILKD